ncbi:dienelactone hydrolase family protein [Candidatus Aquiluna sp. UB-MaderosW2red]|uniref:dienelactone hydrolase family protein n=1 Tax=Candidatus Aquiluna sp. UB-MaderosW2red TaxID=1855377 RepID=UPI000875D129|nr:dienelactone hydrolase family protein [Candidatus Aquiluna sp. UB-MaderosW2red]SCX04833.1 carboxymethylenebutenolidase [Candidatus Aquiluna sp. UB-MaderosW2red]
MKLKDIQINDELAGVLAIPEGPGPFPSVVMVHEVFGVDKVMRAQIERLAGAGYVVLMPDLFSRGGLRKCLTATFKSLASGSGQAFEDIQAAKDLVLGMDETTDQVGVIGFCMGGGFALLHANKGYGASVSNYGMLPKDLDAALLGACPILGNYGGRDGQLKGATKKLKQAANNQGVVNDIKEYPSAGHAFMNPEQAGGPVFGTILRISGARPEPEAAKDAWLRIEDFFAEHLRS